MKVIKKPLSFIFILLFFAACTKQEATPNTQQESLSDAKRLLADNCRGAISDFIKENYLKDAKILYNREIAANPDHSNYNNPEFDKRGIDKILGVIQEVYTLTTAERNLVFEQHKIHALPDHSFKSVIIQATQNAPEIENLIKGTIPTGNAELDEVLTKYGFNNVDVLSTNSSSYTIVLKSSQEYNLIPIINKLKNIASITNAEANGFVGDGNDIKLSKGNNDTLTIEFSIGWGDCAAGCINHESWKFEVVKCVN
jgi:hypothetical protein